MKRLIFLTVILFLVSKTSFSQNNNQSTTYKLNVNGTDYTITEVELNQVFGTVINELLKSRTMREKDIPLWSKTFEEWKYNLSRSTLVWTTYGDRIAKVSLSGPIFLYEDLGLAKDGTAATGNPNKEENKARRIAVLNGTIVKQINNSLPSNQAK